MLPRIFLAALIVSASISSHAQSGRWGAAEDPIVKEIKDAARMWLMTNCGPQPGLAKYFPDDFHGTATDGQRYSRDRALAAGDDRDCQLGEVKVYFFDDSVAVAYGNESSIRKREDGTEWQRCLAWTDTWIKRGEKWLVAAAQDNVVACGKSE